MCSFPNGNSYDCACYRVGRVTTKVLTVFKKNSYLVTTKVLIIIIASHPCQGIGHRQTSFTHPCLELSCLEPPTLCQHLSFLFPCIFSLSPVAYPCLSSPADSTEKYYGYFKKYSYFFHSIYRIIKTSIHAPISKPSLLYWYWLYRIYESSFLHPLFRKARTPNGNRLKILHASLTLKTCKIYQAQLNPRT